MDISAMNHLRWTFIIAWLGMAPITGMSAPLPAEPSLIQGQFTSPADPAGPPTPGRTAVTLRPDHPQTYTVVPGDTLWAIAGRFLEDPWLWPQIWRQNPAIRNPHLIYPGNVIELYYEQGQPRLRLAGGPSLIKLSPTVRFENLNQAIPAIPRNLIQPFLQRSMVSGQAEWSQAPYIIGAADPRLAFAAQDRIYVRGNNFDQRHYRVFRLGKEYRDPTTGESLGFDAIYVGAAVLERDGDPATVLITSSTRQALAGDRLFPADDDIEVYQFMPHAPPPVTQGQIIAAMDGVSLVGQHQTVVLNLGTRDGMKPGQVLGIFQAGRKIHDSQDESTVNLPPERTGLLMVYKVYDRVSYGLVTEATRNIRVLDRVGEP